MTRIASGRGLLIVGLVTLLLLAGGLTIRDALRAARTYRGVGDVVAVDAQRSQVTISHDEIAGLMPAMSMPFTVESPGLLAAAEPGTRVRFDVRQDGATLIVTGLTPIGRADAGRPGLHDHTPHHGGVVSMYGSTHLEIVVTPDGLVRIYPSDIWRRALSTAGWTGSVTLDLPEGKQTMPLVDGGDALEARGRPVAAASLVAEVRLLPEQAPADAAIEMHVLVPLRPGVVGAAFATDPQAPPPPPEGVTAPRAVVTFPMIIAALAADGDNVLVSTVSSGISVWSASSGRVLHGLAAPPPVEVPPDHPPHDEAASVIAVASRHGEAMVGLLERLLRYRIGDGALLAELPARGGMVRDVAWSPAGDIVLVTVFGTRAALVLGAADGAEHRRLPVDGEPTAVAIGPQGRLAAVATESGPSAVFDLTAETPPRPIGPAASSLFFVGERLVAVGADGVLRLWDATSGTPAGEQALARMPVRAAVNASGTRIATGDRDSNIRIYALPSGALVETLSWHNAAIIGLAWAGPRLVSADADHHLAFWDLSDASAGIAASD